MTNQKTWEVIRCLGCGDRNNLECIAGNFYCKTCGCWFAFVPEHNNGRKADRELVLV